MIGGEFGATGTKIIGGEFAGTISCGTGVTSGAGGGSVAVARGENQPSSDAAVAPTASVVAATAAMIAIVWRRGGGVDSGTLGIFDPLVQSSRSVTLDAGTAPAAVVKAAAAPWR